MAGKSVSVGDRLDRLPFSRFHLKFLLLIAVWGFPLTLLSARMKAKTEASIGTIDIRHESTE